MPVDEDGEPIRSGAGEAKEKLPADDDFNGYHVMAPKERMRYALRTGLKKQGLALTISEEDAAAARDFMAKSPRFSGIRNYKHLLPHL